VLVALSVHRSDGRQRCPRVTIAGTVFDSIGGVALRGASVQIVGAADPVLGRRFTALTDSTGRYAIPDVPPGRYLAGFHHPRLDSLGLESEERAVTVTDGNFQLDLATPSPTTFVALVCSDQPTGGLVVGHVRATGTQRRCLTPPSQRRGPNSIPRGLCRPTEPERMIRTAPSGWFALCGLPASGITGRAAAGADSSGYMRLSPTPGSVRVATFHVGGAVRATAQATRSWYAGRVAWRARLSGVVRDERGQPIANATRCGNNERSDN
jgi:protocatechuate 3,4-dioxygenase beta subunit